MARSRLRPLLFALGAALALGVLGRVALRAGGGLGLPYAGALGAAGRAAVALGAPWLVVAWAVGAAAPSRRAGALLGGVALALGTVAWYSLTVAAAGERALPYAWPVAPAWALVAAGAGAAFGLAGALWRSGHALAAAAPAGALAGEAVLLSEQWTGRAAAAVLAAELATAGCLLVLTTRRAPRPLLLALTLATAVAVAVFVGESATRDALRLAGWRGP
jgi:hypothetical protein